MDNSFDARKFFSYLFIFALAVLFALEWGPGARGCATGTTEAKEDVAAQVNGKDIPLKDFVRTYAWQMNQFRAQGGLPPGMAKQLGLHTQVLEQLVTTELLAQAAEQRGIRASDSELAEMIYKNPDFQKDGHFDEEQYRSVLRDFYRRTPVEFEADWRRRLSAQKMLELIEQSASVSDDEVKARYLKDANKAKITFVRFATAAFTSKLPHEKTDPKAWAQAHEKEIADHYANNQFNYHQPERAKVRQILVKAMKEDPAEKRVEGKQKADNLLKEIQGGKDFAEVAKGFSDDQGTRESGGDLGLVERNALPPALAEAVFKANVGDVVGPVETPIGYYLAKVEEKKPPETLPLEKVRMDIAVQLFLKEQSQAMARAEAEKALALARGGKPLVELYPPDKEADTGALKQFMAKEAKPEAVESGEFSSTAMTIPQLGPAEELVKDIFKRTEPGLMDKIYPTHDGFVVVQVTERVSPSDANFESTKEQIKLEATKAKQFELRESFVKSARKAATVKINESAVDKVAEG